MCLQYSWLYGSLVILGKPTFTTKVDVIRQFLAARSLCTIRWPAKWSIALVICWAMHTFCVMVNAGVLPDLVARRNFFKSPCNGYVFYKRRYCFVASIATSHIDHSPASSVVRNVNCHSDCLQESHPNLTFTSGCVCDCLRFIQTKSFFLLISNLFAVVHKWLDSRRSR